MKTCATSCSRLTSVSGQSRCARRVLKSRAPTGGSPPTESGMHRADWMPNRRQVSRSTAASAGRSSIEGGDQPAGQHLLDGPGVLLLAHRVGRTQAFLGAVGVGGHDHPGAAADHCHSTDNSIPSGSQTRRSPSSISRSTSSGGRLMNREERSEISVSNSRRLPRSRAEGRDAWSADTWYYTNPQGRCPAPAPTGVGPRLAVLTRSEAEVRAELELARRPALPVLVDPVAEHGTPPRCRCAGSATT